jgi:hypothetical protein
MTSRDLLTLSPARSQFTILGFSAVAVVSAMNAARTVRSTPVITPDKKRIETTPGDVETGIQRGTGPVGSPGVASVEADAGDRILALRAA